MPVAQHQSGGFRVSLAPVPAAGFRVELQLFGAFRLVQNGKPVATASTQRVQSLIAYLALHRAAPQARAHVAFFFWPDSTESQALTNLRHLPA